MAEDYVHRIGRTGRAGASGEAISLVCVDEARLLQLLLTNAEAWNHNAVEFMDEPFPEIAENTPLAELAELLGGKEQAVMVRRGDASLSILTKSDLIFTLFKAEKASQSP